MRSFNIQTLKITADPLQTSAFPVKNRDERKPPMAETSVRLGKSAGCEIIALKPSDGAREGRPVIGLAS